MIRAMRKKRALVFVSLAVFVGILLAAALPQLSYPLWFDQGAFAACALVLNRGGVFLRDCWDVRGPITPYSTPSRCASPKSLRASLLLTFSGKRSRRWGSAGWLGGGGDIGSQRSLPQPPIGSAWHR